MKKMHSFDDDQRIPLLQHNNNNNNNNSSVEYGGEDSSKKPKSKFEEGISIAILMNVLLFFMPNALTDAEMVEISGKNQKMRLDHYLLSLRRVSERFYQAISSKRILLPIVTSRILTTRFEHEALLRNLRIGTLPALSLGIFDHKNQETFISLPPLSEVPPLFHQINDANQFRDAVFQELSNEESALFNTVIQGYSTRNSLINNKTLFDELTEMTHRFQSPCNRLAMSGITGMTTCFVFMILQNQVKCADHSFTTPCSILITGGFIASFGFFVGCLLLIMRKFNAAKENSFNAQHLNHIIQKEKECIEKAPRVIFWRDPVPQQQADEVRIPMPPSAAAAAAAAAS